MQTHLELAAAFEAGTIDRKALADGLQALDRDGDIADDRCEGGPQTLPMLLEILATELHGQGHPVPHPVALRARNMPRGALTPLRITDIGFYMDVQPHKAGVEVPRCGWCRALFEVPFPAVAVWLGDSYRDPILVCNSKECASRVVRFLNGEG